MNSKWVRGTIESLPVKNLMGVVRSSSGEELYFVSGMYEKDIKTGKPLSAKHYRNNKHTIRVGDNVILKANQIMNTRIYRPVEFYKE